MSDSLTSEKRCPTCGAELQRFTSRLHCPACNKDVTLTSNELYLALAQLRAEVDALVASKEAYIPYHNANRLGVALGKARAVMARNKPTADETPAVVQKAAQHWLDLQRDIPIAWEGGIDAAMLAACNEIRRLSATPKGSEQYHGIGCATRRGGKCNCAAEEVPARDEGKTPEEYRRRLALFGVHVPEKASAEERLAERWPDA